MPTEDATPVIFFIVSLYAFAVVLLYVLARAWEQALSTRRPIAGKGGGIAGFGVDPSADFNLQGCGERRCEDWKWQDAGLICGFSKGGLLFGLVKIQK